jgi:hypothetical protein
MSEKECEFLCELEQVIYRSEAFFEMLIKTGRMCPIGHKKKLWMELTEHFQSEVLEAMHQCGEAI